MGLVKLTKGFNAVIDDNMLEIVSKIRWFAVLKNGKPYAAHQLGIGPYKQRKQYLHHYIVGFPLNGLMVDHINGDGLDNRKENLHIVTRRQNQSNHSRKRLGKTSSKYTGVSLSKHKWKSYYNEYWSANIQINKKKVHLGLFKNEIDAHNAYQAALRGIV